MNRDAEYQRAYRRRRLAQDPGYDKAKAKAQYYKSRRMRLWLIRVSALTKYGGACLCCGETEPHFLVFHHVGLNGHEERGVGYRSRDFYRILVNKDTRADIKVLCANCHQALHRLGYCPHRPETSPAEG